MPCTTYCIHFGQAKENPLGKICVPSSIWMWHDHKRLILQSQDKHWFKNSCVKCKSVKGWNALEECPQGDRKEEEKSVSNTSVCNNTASQQRGWNIEAVKCRSCKKALKNMSPWVSLLLLRCSPCQSLWYVAFIKLAAWTRHLDMKTTKHCFELEPYTENSRAAEHKPKMPVACTAKSTVLTLRLPTLKTPSSRNVVQQETHTAALLPKVILLPLSAKDKIKGASRPRLLLCLGGVHAVGLLLGLLFVHLACHSPAVNTEEHSSHIGAKGSDNSKREGPWQVVVVRVGHPVPSIPPCTKHDHCNGVAHSCKTVWERVCKLLNGGKRHMFTWWSKLWVSGALPTLLHKIWQKECISFPEKLYDWHPQRSRRHSEGPKEMPSLTPIFFTCIWNHVLCILSSCLFQWVEVQKQKCSHLTVL